MSFEVELKFRLTDFVLIEKSLLQLGATEQSTVSHVDRYFNHPSRDFHQTDEAFRVRSVNEANYVTYKGAVLGKVAKTRHEIELGLAPGFDTARQFVEMVQLLGFRFVREVRKIRRCFQLDQQQQHFELSLDDVAPLGQFLEIELIAADEDRTTAEAAVWDLAHKLGLSHPESLSYLDLLLAADNATADDLH